MNFPETIRVKFMASKKEWLSLEELYEKKGTTTFDQVFLYLSHRTPKAVITKLERNYLDDPAEFGWEFYQWFIEPACGKIRLIKERGGNPHGLGWEKMCRIKLEARWIHQFLLYWSKKEYTEYPFKLKTFVTKKCWKRIKQREVVPITKEIIQNRFNIGLGKVGFKIFYDGYIAHKKLKFIKRALKRIAFQPVKWPLSEIF